MINAIALDDEPLALDIIQRFCMQYEDIHLLEVFSDSDKAYQYVSDHSVDLIFLDVEMPSVSGVDFYRSLPYAPLLIFTTAYEGYAVEGFNLEAIDYLLKPFSSERFAKAIQRVKDAFQMRVSDDCDHLMIKSDAALQKVLFDEILYVEAMDNYMKFYLTNARSLLTRMTIRSVMEALPESRFVRIHRSFIVAVGKVRIVKLRSVVIGQVELSVGSSYKLNFMNRFYNK